jgi:hypothetical protein
VHKRFLRHPSFSGGNYEAEANHLGLFVSGHVESLTINIALRSLEGGAATKRRIVTFLPSDRHPPKENMRGLVFELDLGFPR